MREFLLERVLPFLGVCGVVLGLTAVLFQVPSRPVEARTVRGPEVAPRASAATEQKSSMPAPLPADEAAQVRVARSPVVQDKLTEVLGQAMRQVKPTRTAPSPERMSGVRAALNAGEAPTAAEPAPDPGLLGAVTALGEAVKAIHEARNDQDLVRAEEGVRAAREKMEAACQAGGTGAPLCAGAEQIRSLGY